MYYASAKEGFLIRLGRTLARLHLTTLDMLVLARARGCLASVYGVKIKSPRWIRPQNCLSLRNIILSAPLVMADYEASFQQSSISTVSNDYVLRENRRNGDLHVLDA